MVVEIWIRNQVGPDDNNRAQALLDKQLISKIKNIINNSRRKIRISKHYYIATGYGRAELMCM